MERVVELMRQFQDFPLGLADASIIAVAEPTSSTTTSAEESDTR